MKVFSKIAISMAFVSIAFYACEKPPKGDEAEIKDEQSGLVPTGETYAVDTSRSYVKFTGHGVGKNHPGTFKLNYGAVAVNKDSVSGGTFVINVKSMDMLQEGRDIDEKLRPHLLSGDFFAADKFGTAAFEMTNIVPYEEKDRSKSLVEGANFLVSGNLTIKDVTKNVTFPARIDLDGNRITAKANFDIDRTDWRMNYGNDKTLGDKFISETVNIEFHIEATDQEGLNLNAKSSQDQ